MLRNQKAILFYERNTKMSRRIMMISMN